MTDDTTKISTLGMFNKAHPSDGQSLNHQTPSVQHLRRHLCSSLKLRILNVPLPPGSADGHDVRVAVLFSGGLDCTVLARMAHDILPSDQQIDLINVAFENPRVVKAANSTKVKNAGRKSIKRGDESASYQSLALERECLGGQSPFESCPDRATGRKAFRELQSVCPDRGWRFVAVSVPFSLSLLI